jgi:hypothetical protein
VRQLQFTVISDVDSVTLYGCLKHLWQRWLSKQNSKTLDYTLHPPEPIGFQSYRASILLHSEEAVRLADLFARSAPSLVMVLGYEMALSEFVLMSSHLHELDDTTVDI